jgi:hypothetical protein
VTLDRQTLERRRVRGRQRRAPWRLLAALVLLVCVFGVGIALGEALHDNPKPGGSRTTQRTLRPLPLAPAHETVTVTVTVSGSG